MSRNDGCSGQMPLSSTPTVTVSAAWMAPPIDGQTSVAPMNCGVASVCGCSGVSGWTATTPSTASSASISLAGRLAATPP